MKDEVFLVKKQTKSFLLLAAILVVAGCTGESTPPDQATGHITATEKLTPEEKIARLEAAVLPEDIKQKKIAEVRAEGSK